MEPSTLIIAAIVFIILAYLGYRWYVNHIGMDLCTAEIINKLNSYTSSKEDWNAFCVWLDSVDVSCNTQDLQLSVVITTPGNSPRTVTFVNNDGVLVPTGGKVFPSCEEDYPIRGMTMVFNINGTMFTKIWPGPLRR
jgi:hypothetical protein